MNITSKNYTYLQFLAAVMCVREDTDPQLKADLIKKYNLDPNDFS